MKRVTKILVAVGAALSLGLAAAAVSAHPHGYGPGWGGHMGGYGPGMMGGYGPGYGMGPGMMGGYGPGYGMGPQAMFNAYPGASDAQLAGLKSEIGITDKQEGAWKGFVDSVKKQDENRRAWFAKMRAARSAGSAPEVLAQQTEILKQREAELAASAAAVKSLYAALTPEQQAIADQNLGAVCPGWTQGYRGGPRGYAR
jgi:Spy/CpxP family protein refolding chaperone